MKERRLSNAGPVISAVVLLLVPVLYVGSYLALVRPPANWFVASPGVSTMMPAHNYRYGGERSAWFFWPLEQIDRKLRPKAWESGVVFEWLHEATP